MSLVIDEKNVTAISMDNKEVVKIEDENGNVMWEKELPNYFYFEDRSGAANTISCPLLFTDPDHTVSEWVDMEYSTDKVTWTSWDLTQPLSLEANGKVYLRASGGSLCKNAGSGAYQAYHTFSSTGNVYCGGNIAFLLTKEGDRTNLGSGREFQFSFKDMTTLVGVDADLCYTITGLSGTYSFRSTWEGCTNLANVPNFAGITLATQQSFASSFRYCSSLTDVSNFMPNLTATSGNNVFNSCFRDCTSLTSTNNMLGLVYDSGSNVYSNMFNGCTSLNVAYAPNCTTWNTSVFSEWLYDVAASGTLYVYTQELADLIPTNSTSGCPSGWSIVVAE